MYKQYFYAQISEQDGILIVVGLSHLSGEVLEPSLIPIADMLEVKIGDIYRDGKFHRPEEITTVEYTVKNTEITLNGSVLSPFNGIHFANIAEEIQITAEAHDENGVVDITIPISIKMPIVRYANGMPTDDEVYFNTTLQNGLFTINGSFQRSGDWKIVADRINKALQEIGAEFSLSGQNVTLIA
jgi:hypothetical protein